MSTVKTTCPRDCYDRCGLLVTVDGNRIQRVRGDPDNPHTRGGICGKSATAYNGLWRDDSARLLTPLKRSGPKGGGQFTPVGWDEALGAIAARIHRAVATHGAASVLHAHYQGTYSAIACNFPNRFFHRLGATEVDPSTICDKAGHVALQGLYGTSFVGFDPRSLDAAETLFIWGVNPSHSGPLTDRHWISGFKGLTVVVDPLKTGTAARADLHLQLRPGTDVALVYGLLAVMRREGLLDEAFIAAHVRGWPAVEAQCSMMTLERASAITGVAAEAIIVAARALAATRSLLWLGVGLQRQAHGGDITRAVAMLPALTGRLAKPGCGFLYMNGYESVGLPIELLTRPGLALAAAPSLSHMDLATALEDPARSQVFFNWNTNVMASAPNQDRLRGALAREDLCVVVIDLFMTDTARMADYVLPAANFLEFDDLVFSYFQRTVSAQVKLREPPGLALPNQEIFRRLALAMGFTEPELQEPDTAIIEAMLARVRPDQRFSSLSAVGTVFVSDTPPLQFEGLDFATPSGRVEIDADCFAKAGLAPAPLYREPPCSVPGALRLITPSHALLMNSTYGNDPAIARLLGPPTILLCASDAGARGLSNGDMVDVRHGAVTLPLQVQISALTQPGVAVSYKSRWPGLEASRRNINALNPGLRADLGEGSAVNSLCVTVTRAT